MAYSDIVQFKTNIVALGGVLLDAALSSGGFDCSESFNRAQLTASLSGAPSYAANVANGMLAIGATPSMPWWQHAGFTQAPTLSDVQAAMTAISENAAVMDFINNTINPMISAGTTPTAIKAAVAEWSAS